ncbi:MAG TPA: hypothetical protein VFG68_06375, partial [Fimbriiglobus sp.]|nr:hypothetical protein [Fimbriiglobus sp.]
TDPALAGVQRGRAEFEGFEVVQVLLGQAADTFTVGGDSIFPELPVNRRQDANDVPIINFVHTIAGMTLISGGTGGDTLNVFRTGSQTSILEVADPTTVDSSLVVPSVTTQGDKAMSTSEVVHLSINADLGYFVLEFADPTGEQAVRGAGQTRPLPFTATASEIEDALAELRVVGGDAFVEVVAASGGFDITFSALLGNVPALLAFDTPLFLNAGAGEDVINIRSMEQAVYALGGSEDDEINVNVEVFADGTLPAKVPGPDGFDSDDGDLIAAQAAANGVNDLLTLDGGIGSDDYVVYLFGGTTESQINLFDSGGPLLGSDTAAVLGTENADLFLLRAAVADAGLAFVALLKPPVVGTQVDVERVNYTGNIEQIDVFGLGGDDAFGIDDTRAKIDVYGGAGRDFFQVGQLYKSQREPASGVPDMDIFATIKTTRGFLSNGISEPMTIFGGGDNDEFVVYHNLKPLVLNGDDGDDSFLIRAFALDGSQEDLRDRTDVSGDAGADLIQYAVNAPVNIDGGDGFDTVIVIGTEFNDDFVLTENGVFGAGLNVSFVRVESVEVDAAEGDDRFYILGSGAGRITQATGGLGSDTFTINGPTPPVVSNDLLGHSGLINHGVDSSDTASSFAGLKTEGISAEVADDEEPAIRILLTGGTSTVSQGLNDTDGYSVVLTRAPENGATVLVRAFAPRGVEFVSANGVLVSANPFFELDAVFLLFDATNWFVPQPIVFKADDTEEIDGVSAGFITHSIDVQDETLADGLAAGPVAVGAVTLTVAGGGLTPGALAGSKITIIAGTGAGQERDVLGNAASTITVAEPWAEALDATSAFFVTGVTAGVVGDTIAGLFVANSSVAAGARFLDVAGGLPAFAAGADALRGAQVKVISGTGIGQVRLIIGNDSNTIEVSEGWTFALDNTSRIEILRYAGVVLPALLVSIVGDDVPAIDLRETGGRTVAFEAPEIHKFVDAVGPVGDDDGILGFVDAVMVALAKAPGGTIELTLDGAGQLEFVVEVSPGVFRKVTTLSFDAGNWNVPRTVYILGKQDTLTEGFHKAVMTVSGYGAPTSVVVDIGDDEVAGVMVIESDGQTLLIERDGSPSSPPASAAEDTYQVILTKAPTSGETVTVHLIADPTRTAKGAGLRGIRSFLPQVELKGPGGVFSISASTLTFNTGNWFAPQTVTVRAIDDDRLDGGESKSFPTLLDQANKLEGPTVIVGGVSDDRTADLEREPVMLPTEDNFKPSAGTLVAADSYTVTINLNAASVEPGMSVRQLLESRLGITIDAAEDLIDLAIEITRGPAKNKFRLIVAAEDLGGGQVKLTVQRPWEGGLTTAVPTAASQFTIEAVNPNLLVDEDEETDFTFLNDTDNVTSFNELPTAELTVTGDRLTGLGMSGDQMIGGKLIPGGLTYVGLEQLTVNLGPGANKITVQDTHGGTTIINAGAGADEFNVRAVSGHTFLNAGAGADTFTVTNAGLVSGIGALLTLTGDVPQVTATVLGKGSAPDATADVAGASEVQQVAVDATGGTFRLGFQGAFTDALPFNVSADVMEAALFALPGIGANNVQVIRSGNVYRVEFVNGLAETDVPLLEVNDLGLTAEGPGDVLTVDDTADPTGNVGVLTQTSLTGLGMGGFGTPGTTFNEIQTLRIDADGGTFTLSVGGATTAPLAHDISAAGLDAALEAMLATAFGITPAAASAGVVDVSRADDVYVMRFIGVLTNKDLPQVTVNGAGLTTLPGHGTSGKAQTATRIDGINAESIDEVQRLTISATSGTFTLSFGDPANVTAPLAFDLSAADLQLALEGLAGIAAGDVVITPVTGGFDIEFVRELSAVDVPLLAVTPAGAASVVELQAGSDTGMNDVQVLTVNATGGGYQLELFVPDLGKTIRTEVLAFDASAEAVRQALQNAFALQLTGLGSFNHAQRLNVSADGGTFTLTFNGQTTAPLLHNVTEAGIRAALEALSNVELGDVQVNDTGAGFFEIRFVGTLTAQPVALMGLDVSGLTDGTATIELLPLREAFKSDFAVTRVGNTYTIGFLGKTRQTDGGQGASSVKVITVGLAGTASVVTRMDGIDYHGIERLDIQLGSGADVFNVQGTSAGSFKLDLDTVHAATNLSLGGGDDQVFVFSHADLDHSNITETAGTADAFDFLTGDLEQVRGNLNIDAGAGRHRILVSDEADTIGDGT